MTTITERVAPGAQAAEAACGAIGMLFDIEFTCGETPAALYIGACEHEHVRERLLCEFHASHPEAAMCRTCYELPEPHGHECAIALTPAVNK